MIGEPDIPVCATRSCPVQDSPHLKLTVSPGASVVRLTFDIVCQGVADESPSARSLPRVASTKYVVEAAKDHWIAKIPTWERNVKRTTLEKAR